MNTRNRILLFIVITFDVCAFAFGLYLKNQSEDFASDARSYKTIQVKVIDRQSTLYTELKSVQDSLKTCCQR